MRNIFLYTVGFPLIILVEIVFWLNGDHHSSLNDGGADELEALVQSPDWLSLDHHTQTRRLMRGLDGLWPFRWWKAQYWRRRLTRLNWFIKNYRCNGEIIAVNDNAVGGHDEYEEYVRGKRWPIQSIRGSFDREV